MNFAANGVAIAQGYTIAATFPPNGKFSLPFHKLDAFVNGTDAIIQVLEEDTGWTEDPAQEILLRAGFNSREFMRGFLAVRFKVWNKTLLGTTGTVDIHLNA